MTCSTLSLSPPLWTGNAPEICYSGDNKKIPFKDSSLFSERITSNSSAELKGVLYLKCRLQEDHLDSINDFNSHRKEDIDTQSAYTEDLSSLEERNLYSAMKYLWPLTQTLTSASLAAMVVSESAELLNCPDGENTRFGNKKKLQGMAFCTSRVLLSCCLSSFVYPKKHSYLYVGFLCVLVAFLYERKRK